MGVLLASAIETLVRSSNKVSKIYYIHVCKFILKYFVKISFAEEIILMRLYFPFVWAYCHPPLFVEAKLVGINLTSHLYMLASLTPFYPSSLHSGVKKWTLLKIFWQKILLTDKYNLLYSSVFKLHGVNLDANNTVRVVGPHFWGTTGRYTQPNYFHPLHRWSGEVVQILKNIWKCWRHNLKLPWKKSERNKIVILWEY